MHRYVTGTYPTEMKLKILRSRPIVILSTGRSDKLAIAAALAQRDEHRERKNIRGIAMKSAIKLRVAKQI